MRQAVRAASLIAFTVACGYAKMVLFPFLFFVELMSAATVLSGTLVGAAWGAWVGGIARLVFSVANPYGPPHPWVLAAQVLGGAMLGAAGGILRGVLARCGRRSLVAWVLVGLFGTALFDLLTNAAQGVAFGAMAATLALAAIPALQHVGSNTLLFLAVGRLAGPWLERRVAELTILVAALGALAMGTGRASAATPAASDSAAVSGPPVAGAATATVTAVPQVPADSLGPSGLRVPRGYPHAAIDSDRLRFDGRTTAAQVFSSRWPVDEVVQPLAGNSFDAPRLLDAGLALDDHRAAATDRTPVAGLPLFFGAPNAATALAVPGGAASDPFLVVRWDSAKNRPPMAGPGDLLARPRATLWWEGALAPGAARGGLASSALFYEKGERGVEQAGARFAAPSLVSGIAGAYIRRASDGEGACFRATDTRYSLAANLPRAAGWRARVEGNVASRRLETAAAFFDLPPYAAGEALLDDRTLELRAERQSAGWNNTLVAGVGKQGHTLVDVDGTRERWEEPTWRLGSTAAWRPSDAWTWTASAEGRGRGVRSRIGPANTASGIVEGQFALTRNEGRASLSLRRERPGSAIGWNADVAYDARAGDRGFLDARVGASAASRRGIAQLDIESACERATWVDRLAPGRDRYFADALVLPKPIRYSTAADPSLAPRRLTGGVARAVWRVGPRLEWSGTASIRRVTDDFGWNLTRTETVDSILVEDRATRRGSGWTSHVSLGADASWHSVRVHLLVWARRGDSFVTPLAGSPAREGVEASLSAGAKFFQGDLPLRLGLDAHLDGKRTGLIQAPGEGTVDGSLRADFTDAGVFLRVDDLFDRRPPSGAYDLASDAGVPTTGRRFRFGVVWHLSD